MNYEAGMFYLTIMIAVAGAIAWILSRSASKDSLKSVAKQVDEVKGDLRARNDTFDNHFSEIRNDITELKERSIESSTAIKMYQATITENQQTVKSVDSWLAELVRAKDQETLGKQNRKIG
jgi:peptidoglycan hydrolase CwlO-like protein